MILKAPRRGGLDERRDSFEVADRGYEDQLSTIRNTHSETSKSHQPSR